MDKKRNKLEPKWMGWTEIEAMEQYEEEEAIRNLSDKLRQHGFIWIRDERSYVDDHTHAPYVYTLIRQALLLARLEQENQYLREMLAKQRRVPVEKLTRLLNDYTR